MSKMAKGILAAVASNILFGVLFMFSHLMKPMTGTDVFAWRIVARFTACLLLLSLLSGARQDALVWLKEIGLNWRRWLVMVLTTPIVIGQIWLYMWAPVNGMAVDVSVGYFLFPLAMMLGGVCAFGERLDRVQLLAVTLASAGVVLRIWIEGRFSWATVAVFGTFPIYYLIRRQQKVPPLLGLLLDAGLTLPFVAYYLTVYSNSPAMVLSSPKMLVLVLLLGITGASSMLLNLAGNALLPVVLFGMLSYLEPALLFVLSITILGEPFAWSQLVSYGLVAASSLVMLYHGIQTMRREPPV